MEFQIGQLQDITHAISNQVFLNPSDYQEFKNKSPPSKILYGKIQTGIYVVGMAKYLEKGYIGLSKKQREYLRLSQALDKVKLETFQLPVTEYRAGSIKLNVVPVKLDSKKEIQGETFSKMFMRLYFNHFFGKNQEVYFSLD